MSLLRLLILFTGLSLILGLSIWLITALWRLYYQVSFLTPLLATLLLLFILVLIGFLIYGFLYYFGFIPKQYRRNLPKKTNNPLDIVPETKKTTVTKNLQGIRDRVGQIQDKVAREVFLTKSQELEADLAKGDIRIVVFGTGSAGKTSLVNSLIGEIVGDVNAVMGTTTQGETYSLKLEGVYREILITDTPGILEAGIKGTQREVIAKNLAKEADLLLFVVDNDLRKSEYEPLSELAHLGKRSLLVFNKSDLYTDEDKEIILKQLQNRVKNFISPQDVLAISANPQPVQLTSGEIIEPESEIVPLIKRLVAVLRAEGADLIADNILLQCRRLGTDAIKIIEGQKLREADLIIDRYQWIGGGVIAVTPLPVVDILATTAVNAQMVVEIGKVYGCEIDREKGKELAFSLGKTLVSLGIVEGTVDIFAKALQFNVATYIIGKAIQAVSAAYLTRIAGKSFIEYFRREQNWGDGGMREVVQRQFQLSRRDEFVKSFVKDAISRVVKPLSDTWEDSREYETDDW